MCSPTYNRRPWEVFRSPVVPGLLLQLGCEQRSGMRCPRVDMGIANVTPEPVTQTALTAVERGGLGASRG